MRAIIGIGAPRSGTTSLFRWLKHHPDIYAGPIKEVNFFNRSLSARVSKIYRKYKLGNSDLLSVSRDLIFVNNWLFSDRDAPGVYGKLMIDPNKIFVEITPGYARLDRSAITAACRCLEGVDYSMFYILRNPFHRDISHILFKYHRNAKRNEALTETEYHEIIDSPEFAVNSQYGKNLARWRRNTSRDIDLFYFDDLITNPKKFLRSFCRKYDVDNKSILHSKLGHSNRSNVRGQFDIKLPNTVLRKLAERHLNQIDKWKFVRNDISALWIDEIQRHST